MRRGKSEWCLFAVKSFPNFYHTPKRSVTVRLKFGNDVREKIFRVPNVVNEKFYMTNTQDASQEIHSFRLALLVPLKLSNNLLAQQWAVGRQIRTHHRG